MVRSPIGDPDREGCHVRVVMIPERGDGGADPVPAVERSHRCITGEIVMHVLTKPAAAIALSLTQRGRGRSGRRCSRRSGSSSGSFRPRPASRDDSRCVGVWLAAITPLRGGRRGRTRVRPLPTPPGAAGGRPGGARRAGADVGACAVSRDDRTWGGAQRRDSIRHRDRVNTDADPGGDAVASRAA